MSQEKPPGKKPWDTLTRHLKRKPHGTEAQPPPEPITRPPPTAEVLAMRKSLAEAMSAAPQDTEEERKGGALPTWKADGFKFTEEQAKVERDPGVQMGRLMDYARERPVLATVVLLLAVSILVVDAIMIARRLGVTEWLMVNYDDGKDDSRRFEVWERKGSGLAYFGGGDAKKEVVEPNQASAVDGKDKLPKPQKPPALSGGLAGIITPAELADGMRASFVTGLGALQGDSGMSGSFVKTAADDFRPYAPAAGAPTAIPTGAFFGEAGEALENFGALDNPSKPAEDYGGPNYAALQEVPPGLQGDDMVMAMIGDDFKKDMKEYAKGGRWKLRKLEAGEATARHELAGMTLTGNDAVIQLLQTKRATDVGLKCGSCNTERRIHNTRAPFYGEEH
ncbi:MAG: hypothetical protein HYZ75_16095 [Elusimicrobia bacterium]|nr:hypothetical protein [Elusimicrobiota bacterium]